MYPYGLIGNCQISALIDHRGSIDWLCLPRPDSQPVFGRLLDADAGHFSVRAAGEFSTTQRYLPNTNVLETVFEMKDGSRFKVTDFCPRFWQYERMFRPACLFRIVEPLAGTPVVQINCQPISGWDKEKVRAQFGSNHFSFAIRNDILRVVTNASLTYLHDDRPFVLSDTLYFGLSWNSSIEDDLPSTAQRFLNKTIEYWRSWVKHCSIPVVFQQEVIRSALALKLHCFEDTGAILAALTTSLPEEAGRTRNWDYRYCWLRDAYFVLSALHRLGHFEETERFLEFLLNLAHQSEATKASLKPVYRLDRGIPAPEREHPAWHGYRGSKPVRSFNQAAEHVQNDVYGEMILTLAPIFFDDRFAHLRIPEHERLLEHLLSSAIRTVAEPDAGLWEIRENWQVHSFSVLMSWAGIDRAIKLKQRGFLKETTLDLNQARTATETALMRAVVNGSLRNGPQDPSYDAALLQLAILRFPDRALSALTVDAIQHNLGLATCYPDFLYRYTRQDDFGIPKSAFVVCSFWLVQALASLGRVREAERVMNSIQSARNHLGLLSEHFVPLEGCQMGNFPQAYSHVGLINAAFSISPTWSDVL